MKCYNCDGTMKVTREDYRYRESGLPNVILRGVEMRRCAKCGENEVVLLGLEQLHKSIADQVASKAGRLNHEEIRFLRVFLGLSGKDFAKELGVDPATVSRWETQKQHISRGHELILRLWVNTRKAPTEYPIKRTVSSPLGWFSSPVRRAG